MYVVHRAKRWVELSLLRRQLSYWGKSEIFSLPTPKLALTFQVSGFAFYYIFICPRLLFTLIFRGSPSKRLSQP